MNNASVVAYVNHKGDIHSLELLKVTLQLWDWCILDDQYIIVYTYRKNQCSCGVESRKFGTTATGW